MQSFDLTHGRSTHQSGLSLVESLVLCLILAVLLSLALPALRDLTLRQRLHGTAQMLMTDLQQARGEAVRGAESVQFRFSRHASGSCYVVHTGPAGDCRCEDGGEPVCTGEGVLLKSQWLPGERSIAVTANVQGLGFQARQGAVTNTGSIDIRIGDGTGIRHVVSIAGRVRSCALSSRIAGLPSCQA